MSWSAAKSYCEGEGTVLATISDGFQEAFVHTMVYKNNGDPLYIGLLNDQVLFMIIDHNQPIPMVAPTHIANCRYISRSRKI